MGNNKKQVIGKGNNEKGQPTEMLWLYFDVFEFDSPS